jgi:DNA-binding GntR family transcriptional regulator
VAEVLEKSPFADRSKSSAVYFELRTRILSTALSPAAGLNQEQLAEELGVSTTPLREALRRLQSEGLVTLMAHREAIVSPLDPAELAAIYEVRAELDPLAAALAAERHTSSEAAAIRAATERARKPGRQDRLSANRRYHSAIYAACHNPVLVETLDRLWDRSDRYRRAVGFIATDPSIQEEHMAIAEAVLERRSRDSSRLMRRHIKRTCAAFHELNREGDRMQQDLRVNARLSA